MQNERMETCQHHIHKMLRRQIMTAFDSQTLPAVHARLSRNFMHVQTYC